MLEVVKAWAKRTFAYKELRGVWTPAVTGSTGGGSTTSTATGVYTRLANVCWYSLYVAIDTAGGTGNVRVSLPYPAALSTARAAAATSGVDLPGTPVSLVFFVDAGNSYGQFQVVQDDGAASTLTTTGLATGDVLTATGLYFV